MDYINKVVQEVFNLRESLTYRLDNINNFLSENMASVSTVLHNINQNFLNKIAGISQQIKNLSDSLIYRVNNIMLDIDALPQTMANAIKEKFPALQQTLDQILEKIHAYEEIEITEKQPVFDEALGDLGLAEDQLVNKTDDGKKYVPVYIGRAKDLLVNYMPALLAVGAMLSLFLNLPIIGDLVQFSLALGIFALIVNLANTSISKSNDNSVKGKKSVAKGG